MKTVTAVYVLLLKSWLSTDTSLVTMIYLLQWTEGKVRYRT